MKTYVVVAIAATLLLFGLAATEAVQYHYYRQLATTSANQLLAAPNAPARGERLCNLARSLNNDAPQRLQDWAQKHCHAN